MSVIGMAAQALRMGIYARLDGVKRFGRPVYASITFGVPVTPYSCLCECISQHVSCPLCFFTLRPRRHLQRCSPVHMLTGAIVICRYMADTAARGRFYLYFEARSERWVIGPDYTVSRGYVVSSTSSGKELDAHLVPPGSWVELDGATWKRSPDGIKTECKYGTVGPTPAPPSPEPVVLARHRSGRPSLVRVRAFVG